MTFIANLRSQRGVSAVEATVGLMLGALASVAALAVLQTARVGTEDTFRLAGQTAQVRKVMNVAQSRLAQAQSLAVLAVPSPVPSTPIATDVVYARSGDGTTQDWYAERLAWIDSSDDDDLQTPGVQQDPTDREVVLQQIRSTSGSLKTFVASLTTPAGWQARYTAPQAGETVSERVLARKVENFQVQFRGSARRSLSWSGISDTQWTRYVGLARVVLERDEDGTSEERYPLIREENAVFLPRMSQRDPGNASDPAC